MSTESSDSSDDAVDGDDPIELWQPRWRGRPGRLEVWYATMTDAATGAGLWVHGETVAPRSGTGAEAGDGLVEGDKDAGAAGTPATAHGWVAWFPSEGKPVWSRSGAEQVSPPGEDPPAGFSAGDLTLGPGGTKGTAGDLEWDITWRAAEQEPLYTFPKWAWARELLPAAQIVPAPSMQARGWVRNGDTRHEIEGHAAASRIYGHGNAQRWGWLHADLGDGNVIELVSAVSTRPVLSALAPITFLRMRVDGTDWPRTRVACWGLRAHLDLPQWRIQGRTQGVEVDLEVTQPPERCVSIDYTDPNGATATCTNTERADLALTLRWQDGRSRTWRLDGTAHAEIGRRP